MECEEAIYSNDYYDFIMEYVLRERPLIKDCVQKINDTYEILYLPRIATCL